MPRISNPTVKSIPEVPDVTASTQFMQVHRFVTRAVGRADLDTNLTVRQIAILTTLRLRACSAGVKDLAAYLHVQKPVVTRALDRLGELGLTTRQTNASDRRTVDVALTAAGEQLTNAIGAD